METPYNPHSPENRKQSYETIMVCLRDPEFIGALESSLAEIKRGEVVGDEFLETLSQ